MIRISISGTKSQITLSGVKEIVFLFPLKYPQHLFLCRNMNEKHQYFLVNY